MDNNIKWITKNGVHIPLTNDYMNNKIRNKNEKERDNFNKEELVSKIYELDMENSWISYATPTQKKYFKFAVDFAQKNKMNDVKVNKIEYHFDFDNMSVKMGTANDLTTYKLKVKE